MLQVLIFSDFSGIAAQSKSKKTSLDIYAFEFPAQSVINLNLTSTAYYKEFVNSWSVVKTDYLKRFYLAGLSQAGGSRGARASPLFDRSVNPISTRGGVGGAHYPHPVLCALPDFPTLRRPCLAFAPNKIFSNLDQKRHL